MDGNARIYEFMDQSVVEALLREHLSGHQNKRLLIWSLLNVEQYLKDTLHA
jgi:asparagine synthase (glutamine-hydrolysing)